MIIVGAGMAGLLAAQHFRHQHPVVWERSPRLPNNHGALLRFRSRAIMDITGAPLKQVTVHKAIMERDGRLVDRCSLLHMNAYAKKVAGKIMPRSITNLEPVTRWVPDKTFLNHLAAGVDVKYNIEVNPGKIMNKDECYISTAPMRLFTDHLDLNIKFESQWITTIETEFYDVDVQQTCYIPWQGEEIHFLPYRISLIGSRMIIEIMGNVSLTGEKIEKLISEMCVLLFDSILKHGEVSIKYQPFGKIVPLADVERRELLALITERYNVYSLGRFATWRNILLDEAVKDLKVIENLIKSGSGRYTRQLHYGKAAQ